jgi:hypothetical protein
MSYESQRVYLSDKVAKADLGLPVRLPNIDFVAPKNQPYAEFWIMGTKAITIGGAGEGKVMNRYVGLIQFNVFVPGNSGTKASTIAHDKFAKLFQNKKGRDAEGNNYTFKMAEVMNPQTAEGHTVQVVRVPFHRDAIEPIQTSL